MTGSDEEIVDIGGLGILFQIIKPVMDLIFGRFESRQWG
jgi:hypothetical protein